VGCGRTDSFTVGADDMSESLKDTRRERVVKIRRERAAARLIQHAYRRSLYLRHGRAERDYWWMYDKGRYRLASIIQSMYRMRLAKRRMACEIDLLVIKVG